MNNNFLEQPTQDPEAYARRIENMYPGLYHQLMPYIDNAVMYLGDDNDNLSEDQLNGLTYQIVQNSGILRDMPSGHNERTIDDIVKVLLLSTIMDQYQEDPPYYPYFAPYPYAPFFFPRFRDGFRRGYRRGYRRR